MVRIVRVGPQPKPKAKIAEPASEAKPKTMSPARNGFMDGWSDTDSWMPTSAVEDDLRRYIRDHAESEGLRDLFPAAQDALINAVGYPRIRTAEGRDEPRYACRALARCYH